MGGEASRVCGTPTNVDGNISSTNTPNGEGGIDGEWKKKHDDLQEKHIALEQEVFQLRRDVTTKDQIISEQARSITQLQTYADDSDDKVQKLLKKSEAAISKLQRRGSLVSSVIGYVPAEGYFHVEMIPPLWKRVFLDAGLSDHDLQTPQLATTVYLAIMRLVDKFKEDEHSSSIRAGKVEMPVVGRLDTVEKDAIKMIGGFDMLTGGASQQHHGDGHEYEPQVVELIVEPDDDEEEEEEDEPEKGEAPVHEGITSPLTAEQFDEIKKRIESTATITLPANDYELSGAEQWSDDRKHTLLETLKLVVSNHRLELASQHHQ